MIKDSESKVAGGGWSGASARRRAAALLVLLLLPLAPAADAKQAVAHTVVRATVLPYAAPAVVQPIKIEITLWDAILGYVDVPNRENPKGSALTVTGNDRAGYWIIFGVAAAQQHLYTSIVVTGLGQKTVLSPAGGKVLMPYSGRTAKFTLGYRFYLSWKAREALFTLRGRPDLIKKAEASALTPADIKGLDRDIAESSYPWPLTISIQPI